METVENTLSFCGRFKRAFYLPVQRQPELAGAAVFEDVGLVGLVHGVAPGFCTEQKRAYHHGGKHVNYYSGNRWQGRNTLRIWSYGSGRKLSINGTGEGGSA